ncbi:B12-binding domain-containing radical SAM protein [Microbaculum marinum]|uniref:Radical SAM protein n=1 Tax=Microbaculum marinum TaxID=1764581 RepID=A0AAW9RRF0_9HYPH
MKLLLVAPRHELRKGEDSPLNAFDASIGGYEMSPSTSIATVAAMVPDGIDVELLNEATQTLPPDSDADVIGITANVSQAQRAIEIADAFRARGKTVVVGGPHVSLLPEMFADHCDSMVVGELEPIAETFFADMAAGTLQRHYAGRAADMRTSPAPRWDLYPHERLVSGVVQSSRGCPFTCNFCDVIQYLGNRQRHKDPGQVIDEIQRLYDLGFSSILIADDNFTANRKVARTLLQAIIDWNGADGRDPVSFQTQMSINMTRHDDMLADCHRAGILTNFVGIETSDPLALEECDKRPNKGFDLISQCEKSVRAGIKIEPAFIVGFDSDTLESFEQQFRFAMALPAGSARVGPLVAPVATPLFDEMREQGRLLEDPSLKSGAPPYFTSNFEPAQMTREELYVGLRWLISRLYHPDSFLIRLEKIVRLLAPPPWADQGPRRGRKPRPLATWLASTVIREAVKLDPSFRGVIDEALASARHRPEIGSSVSEVVIRYLAILVNLSKNGMYDPAWAKMDAPPFDIGFSDDRMARLQAWQPIRIPERIAP